MPFTMPHFRAWTADLVLDSGDSFVLEDFQALVVADLFAGYAEIWDVVPEGNGKSTLLALIALYYAEFQAFAVIPVAAASREQAEILYRQAEGFVLRTPRLHQVVESPVQLAKGKQKTDVPRFVCLEGYRRINHADGGRIQVFAADDRTGDGIIPTLGIIDELHRHRNLALYRTWAGKLAKRNGQIVTISTAGEPGTEFELTRERIRRQADEVVRKGCFTRAASRRVVLHEWALPEKADPLDFALVKRANPFSGVTEDGLREKFGSATMTLGHWTRFVCNRPTRAENSAITEAEWSAWRAPEPIPVGVPVMLGMDLAWRIDPAAIVPLWVRDESYRQLGEATVLVPRRDGTSLELEDVKRAVRAVHERNPVTVAVMDTSDARDVAEWLESEIGCQVVEWPQTNPQKVKDFNAFMLAGRSGVLHHSGDAALTAHAMNAIAYVLPLGDAKFERPYQGRNAQDQERRAIDALAAASFVNCWASTPAEQAQEAFVAWA